MTAHSDFDRHLSAWLAADAPTQEPAQLLDKVLTRTARTRRRPVWLIPDRWVPGAFVSARMATTSRVPWEVVGIAVIASLALAVSAAVYVGTHRHTLPAPFGPATNGQIVYSKDGDIVTHDSTSGVERTLVGGPGFDIGAWFSRNGSMLAFFRRASDLPYDLMYDIWVTDQDGTHPRRIGGPLRQPGWIEWSPSGDAMVVSSIVDDKLAMTLVTTDGSGTMTYLDVGVEAVDPTFRPTDGGRLLFRGKGENGEVGLYLVDRDGGNLVRLGLDPGLQAAGFPSDFGVVYFESPRWSPDGRRIAFQSYSPMPGSVDGRGNRIHVADIGPTGTVTAEMTLIDDPLARDEGFAAWLPGSDGIVYQRNEPDALDHLALTMLTPGPTAAHELGPNGPILRMAMVSPDGAKALFFVDDGTLNAGDLPPFPARLTDLASGGSEDAGFTSQYPPSWQRTAP